MRFILMVTDCGYVENVRPLGIEEGYDKGAVPPGLVTSSPGGTTDWYTHKPYL